MTVEEAKERLVNYPGPHANEAWKLERDLNKCTKREKAEIKKLGLNIQDLMNAGLNRGEVAHILFGYRFTV